MRPEQSRRTIWILAIALAVLHQDFWFWDSTRLLFGFLPVGLFYHALFSIASALLWLTAVKYAWPKTIADEAPAVESEGGGE